METKWKPVVGFEGWYDVSNTGLIKRVRPGKSTFVGRIVRGRIRKKDRRVAVYLCKDGQDAQRSVHRVVAEAFLGPCPEGMEVNHLDGDPTNNQVSNLEYCTRQDNMRHAYRLGLVTLNKGATHHLAKLSTDQVRVIRECSAPSSVIARVFGVSKPTVNRIRALKVRRDG